MEALAAIAFVLAASALFINWIAKDGGAAPVQEPGAADPCDTCVRWTECNGVDAEFCEVRKGMLQ